MDAKFKSGQVFCIFFCQKSIEMGVFFILFVYSLSAVRQCPEVDEFFPFLIFFQFVIELAVIFRPSPELASVKGRFIRFFFTL